MKPVQLNRRLRLEAPVVTSDGAGGFTQSWSVLGEVWAEVQAGAGRSRGGEEVSLSIMPFRITVRAAPPGSERRPAPGQRLTEPGRVFEVLAVAEHDSDGRYLTCFAKEERPA